MTVWKCPDCKQPHPTKAAALECCNSDVLEDDQDDDRDGAAPVAMCDGGSIQFVAGETLEEELPVQDQEFTRELEELIEEYANEYDVPLYRLSACLEAYADMVTRKAGIPDAAVVSSRFPHVDLPFHQRIRRWLPW